MMTGHGTSDVERAAEERGAAAFLHKPFLIPDLLAVIEPLLARWTA
jgi:FixJ family two-component response regulator